MIRKIWRFLWYQNRNNFEKNEKRKDQAPLTAHNLQKWKRVFLTWPCHKIYRDEAVCLKSCKYAWKITIYVNMCNLGQFRENLIFCHNCLIEVRIYKFFLHMCGIYNCDYLQHNTFRFNFINFQLNTYFPSQFCVFTVKSPSVTQRSVSQENAFKKSRNPSPFFTELWAQIIISL